MLSYLIVFQFTHPGKGATEARLPTELLNQVSIHAPWEGCDLPHLNRYSYVHSFNSRTLGRVRLRMFDRGLPVDTFQFTHPGKGATEAELTVLTFKDVSIHAPWEGCDSADASGFPICSPFQFTHPGKGATQAFYHLRSPAWVSIHAPWEGCDFY